jgi:rubrerythrin
MKTLKQRVYGNVREETEAINEYKGLAKQLRASGHKREARSVDTIRRDETDHHRILQRVQKKLGGK